MATDGNTCLFCPRQLSSKNKTRMCPLCWCDSVKSGDVKAAPRRVPKKNHHQPLLLEDDGIIDELAVHIAAYGERKVRLTVPERIEACAIMQRMHLGVKEMSERIGCSTGAVEDYLGDLGYEVIRDPAVSALHYKLITRKDRKQEKVLEPEMPRSQKPTKSENRQSNLPNRPGGF